MTATYLTPSCDAASSLQIPRGSWSTAGDQGDTAFRVSDLIWFVQVQTPAKQRMAIRSALRHFSGMGYIYCAKPGTGESE